jgi:hypothetical protein
MMACSSCILSNQSREVRYRRTFKVAVKAAVNVALVSFRLSLWKCHLVSCCMGLRDCEELVERVTSVIGGSK